MQHSYEEALPRTCQTCRNTFSSQTWLIVDANEHPDLLAHIYDGRLWHARCPYCDAETEQLATPLLVFRPDSAYPLIFSPSTLSDPERNLTHVRLLIRLLRERLGSSWQEAWIADGIPQIARETLVDDLRRLDEQPPPSDSVDGIQDNTQQAGHEVYAQAQPDYGFAVPTELRPLLGAAGLAQQQYVDTGDPNVLEQALHAWANLLQHEAFATADESFRMAIENDSAAIYFRRYTIGGSINDLNHALELWRSAATRPPRNPQDRIATVANIGIALRARYLHTGQTSDLEDSIAVCRTAVAETSLGTPSLPTYLSSLATSLNDRYALYGKVADLEEAIDLYQKAVAIAPTAAPNRAMLLNNLGTGLRDRFMHTGHIQDLDHAIMIHEQSVSATSQYSLDRAGHLNNLGAALQERFQHRSQAVDLNKAIAAYSEAVDRTPRTSINRGGYLNNLGAALRDRYFHRGAVADLDQSIKICRAAIAATPVQAPNRAGYLSNLGVSLHARSGRTGEQADLLEAIRMFREAVEYPHTAAPDHAIYLNNLGNALSDLYMMSGEPEQLAEAISVLNAALDITPTEAPDRASRLNNIGNCFRLRYERTGRLADLEEAITYYRVALTTIPPGSGDLPSRLNNLGNSLRTRYMHTGQVSDLEETLQMYQAAVDNASPTRIEYAGYINNLGSALYEQFLHTESLPYLEQAIAMVREALRLAATDSPDRPGYLTNLGNGLGSLYSRLGQLDVLDQAIEAHLEAVDRTLVDAPGRAMFLANLGSALRDRYQQRLQLEDLERAQQAFAEACQAGLSGAPEAALRAARTWGEWASQRGAWAEAVTAYRFGLEALTQLYGVQLLRTDKNTWLGTAQGFHTRAAYALARAGYFEEAVVALERGRTRVAGDTILRDRADLVAIQQVDPKLYKRYTHIAEQLRELEQIEYGTNAGVPDDHLRSTLTSVRRQAATLHQEWHEVIECIREVPGHQSFLSEVSWSEIATVVCTASEQTLAIIPLVYLGTTPLGSFALVVYAEQDGQARSDAIWLDEFTLSDLDRLLVHGDEQNPAGYLAGQLLNPRLLLSTLDDILLLLGSQIFMPLAAHLRSLSAAGLMMIPGGRLGLLPLHAARYEHAGRQIYLQDEFKIHYAPSARVFHAVRGGPSLFKQASKFIGVGDTSHITHPLTFARVEIDAITGFFPHHEVLYGQVATKTAVFGALAGATHLHLACHGRVDVEEPLNSWLELADDERLTLRDILEQPVFRNIRQIVLSACETAIPEFQRVPDEVISFPSAFLQAGVPTVISTLWSVDDLSTAMLMREFYRRLNVDNNIAVALYAAQVWLREATTEALGLAEIWDQIYQASGRRDITAFRAQRYFRAHPEEKPFAHPYYWAAFMLFGGNG